MCWTHLNDTTPKARKEHSCHLCGLPIAVGTVHVARRGVYDGEAITMRMHTDCEQVTHKWSDNDWDNFEVSDFLAEKARHYAKETQEGLPSPALGLPGGEEVKSEERGGWDDNWTQATAED